MAGNTTAIDTSERLEQAAITHSRGNRAKAFLSLLLIIIDMVMLLLAFVLGYYLRGTFPATIEQPPLSDYIPTIFLHVTIIIAISYFSRLYHMRQAISRFDLMRNIVGVVTLGALLASALQELLFNNSPFEVNYPRTMFLFIWLLSVLFVLIGREIHHRIKTSLRARGLATENLLIVGTEKIARDITHRIKNSVELGYNIVGVVTMNGGHTGKMLGYPIIGNYLRIPELIDLYQVEQVIIAVPSAQRTELVELVTLCQRGRVDIKVYPDIFAYMAGDLNVDELGGMPLLTVRDIALRGWKLSLKRGLDLFGSAMGLIFLSPLLLLTAIFIRLESRGPVFYAQIRMGLDGRPFPMIKFRSMQVDAEAEGPGWTTEDDPRITRIGSFIRRTSWDEMPQLINVLLGHMSLVGPRPERPVWVQEFRQKVPRYMERHREKAGMTGWAQVNGLRGDTSIAERTAHDLWYVENWSLWLDLKIIFRTITMILLRRSTNAY